MTLSPGQALNRLQPILRQFGYQQPAFFQALEDRFYYIYFLTKGNHTFKLFMEYWRVQERLTPFLGLWIIDVPHQERFMIYTSDLQGFADSLLYDTYCSR